MYPELELGARTLPSFSVVIVLAVLACWALLVPRMRRLGHAPAAVLVWVVLALPVGVLGAGLGEAVIGWLGGVEASGGYTVLGAVVACFAFALVWAPVALHASPGAVLDPVAFTLPLCHGLGRIGCLLQGCCFGHETTRAPGWLTVDADRYAPGTAAAEASRAGAELWNLPLLLGLLSVAVLVVAELLWRKRARWRLPVGSIAMVTIGLLCIGRAALDWFRGGAALGDADAWTVTGWILGALAFASLALLRRMPRYA